MPRRLHLLLPAAVLLASPWAMAAPATKPVTPPAASFEDQVILPADGPYVVKLDNLKGRVLVRGWNKNVVVVQAIRRATHPLSAAEAAIFGAGKTLIARPDAQTVAIETAWTGFEKVFPSVMLTKLGHVSVDYTVVVPPETAVQVRQEQGAVTAYGVNGRVTVFTRDGAIEATAVEGLVEATNERGDMAFSGIEGDTFAETQHGHLSFQDFTGDIRAKTNTGDVRIDVTPRFVGEVSSHTLRGLFRSDLATFATDLAPGDTGYVGVLKGPLAGKSLPEVRIKVDTVSGTTTIANQRTGWR